MVRRKCVIVPDLVQRDQAPKRLLRNSVSSELHLFVQVISASASSVKIHVLGWLRELTTSAERPARRKRSPGSALSGVGWGGLEDAVSGPPRMRHSPQAYQNSTRAPRTSLLPLFLVAASQSRAVGILRLAWTRECRRACRPTGVASLSAHPLSRAGDSKSDPRTFRVRSGLETPLLELENETALLRKRHRPRPPLGPPVSFDSRRSGVPRCGQSSGSHSAPWPTPGCAVSSPRSCAPTGAA